MTILIERKCGCIAEEGTIACPKCGYDPDCVCCHLYPLIIEEETCIDRHCVG